MASINPEFPLLFIDSDVVESNWLSKKCKSFFFCCSLEPAGDDFEFRLTGYSQDVIEKNENNKKKQFLAFEVLTPQPQILPDSLPISPDLTKLVMNDMYIRYDSLNDIVQKTKPFPIVFYPATKGNGNNVAYFLLFIDDQDGQVNYLTYSDLSSRLEGMQVTVAEVDGWGAVQLNPCPPADSDVIEVEDIIRP